MYQAVQVAADLVPEVSAEQVLVRAAAAGLRVWEVSVVAAVVAEVVAEVLVAGGAVAAVVVVVAVVAEGGKES